jgi:hypothetical protein
MDDETGIPLHPGGAGFSGLVQSKADSDKATLKHPIK